MDCGSVIHRRIECFVAFMPMFEDGGFKTKGWGGKNNQAQKTKQAMSQRQEKDDWPPSQGILQALWSWGRLEI